MWTVKKLVFSRSTLSFDSSSLPPFPGRLQVAKRRVRWHFLSPFYLIKSSFRHFLPSSLLSCRVPHFPKRLLLLLFLFLLASEAFIYFFFCRDADCSVLFCSVLSEGSASSNVGATKKKALFILSPSLVKLADRFRRRRKMNNNQRERKQLADNDDCVSAEGGSERTM